MTHKKYIYRLYCKTERNYILVHTTSDTPPTQCPNDQYHSIDPNSVEDITAYESNKLTINGSLPVNKKFEIATFTFTGGSGVPNDTITEYDISFDMDVEIASMRVFNTTSHLGNFLDAILNPGAVLATITENIDNSTIGFFGVSSIANLKIGYNVLISDGGNTDDVGRIIDIDDVNSQIKVKTPPTNSFTSGAEIQSNIYYTKNFHLGDPYINYPTHNVQKTLFFKQGNILRIRYHNTSGGDKDVALHFEIYY